MHRHKTYRRSLTLLCVLLAVVGIGYWATRHQRQRRFRNKIMDIVHDRSQHHRIDPVLVLAVIKQESKFDPDVRGAAGEYGLMQITRGAATDWERKNRRALTSDGLLFTPELNLEIGIWYLSQAMNQFAGHPYQVELALSQYNAGRTRALRWAKEYPENLPEHIPIRSTRHYIRCVIQNRDEYRRNQQAYIR